MNIDPIERANLTLSAGAVAASLVFASPAFAAGLATGALLEAVNFRGLRRQAQFLFWGQIQTGGGWTGGRGICGSISLLAARQGSYPPADANHKEQRAHPLCPISERACPSALQAVFSDDPPSGR